MKLIIGGDVLNTCINIKLSATQGEHVWPSIKVHGGFP